MPGETDGDVQLEHAIHDALAHRTEGAAPDYQKILATWFNASIQNSPVARSTEAYNHVLTVAIPDLLERLKAAG
jgi:hypothetical protein